MQFAHFGQLCSHPGKNGIGLVDELVTKLAERFSDNLQYEGFLCVDDGGQLGIETYQGRDAFALTTQKRKRDVWCPIMPPLAADMRAWERRPGPYLLQKNGKPFTRKEFARQFAEARDAIPELKGLTLHGLRATAVINLRRAGMSYAQIGDIVGMSAKMVEHYCKNADMRANSRAALTHLERAMAR